MKTKKEILKYYGMCCVSEVELTKRKDYPAGEKGKDLEHVDNMRLENILGQKKAIEFICS